MAAPVLPATDPAARAWVAQALQAGRIGAIPTETVYGLAADIRHLEALHRVFAVKGRPLLDPLIVHLASLEEARSLALWNEAAEALAGAFWPGPLTLVLPRTSRVPDLVTAGLPTVALRLPAQPDLQAVLQLGPTALAAPSANPFGRTSPTRAEHVLAMLGDRIDFILDAGPCRLGLESTVLDLSRPGQALLLRPGPLSQEDLASALTRSGLPWTVSARNPASPAPPGPLPSPGLLDRHYSPRTPLVLFSGPEDLPTALALPLRRPPRSCAIVWVARPSAPPPETGGAGHYWLSDDGDPATAARGLYDLLHRLDDGSSEVLAIQRFPGASGWSAALNDRLRRAAGPADLPSR